MPNNEVDRLSALTDSLILIIISFLPFKDAAKTSVLSTRWRNLWHEKKEIEFDESFFVDEQQSRESKEVARRAFIDFSNQWIQAYSQPSVRKFRFAFSYPQGDHAVIQRFIQFAVARGVKVLDLDFSDPAAWNEPSMNDDDRDTTSFFELPTFVYDHVGLESLNLFACKFRVPSFTNFTALKSLSLGWVDLSSSDLEALISNCPLLESLSLRKCWDLEYIDISSERLRSLVVDKCPDLENGMRLNAPNLRVFTYSGLARFFDIEYTRSMVEADLEFGSCENEFLDTSHGEILYQLVGDLWCIRVLTVCSYMLQVIPSAEGHPPFNGVKHLILKTTLHTHEYHGISFFLNCCPHLELLILDLLVYPRIFRERGTHLALTDHEFLSTHEYVRVYGCMTSSLRVLKIKGFKGYWNELAVIKYLLCYTPKLETVSITLSKEHGPGGGDMASLYLENAQMVLEFPRASTDVQILID